MDVPIPGMGAAIVVAPAPGEGHGNWSGAPSATLDAQGAVVLAYRIRLADGRGVANLVARSADGERFTTVVTIAGALRRRLVGTSRDRAHQRRQMAPLCVLCAAGQGLAYRDAGGRGTRSP